MKTNNVEEQLDLVASLVDGSGAHACHLCPSADQCTGDAITDERHAACLIL